MRDKTSKTIKIEDYQNDKQFQNKSIFVIFQGVDCVGQKENIKCLKVCAWLYVGNNSPKSCFVFKTKCRTENKTRYDIGIHE